MARRRNRYVFNLLVALAGLVVLPVLALLSGLVVEPFNIPSSSMVPTLRIGDQFLVSKFAYGYSRHSLPFGLPLFNGRILAREPQRGDVVVLKSPSDNETSFVKRIVGLPGDRIQMKGGLLFINDTAVDRERIEDYADDRAACEPCAQYVETLPNGRTHRIVERSDDSAFDNTGMYVVPAGHYFGLGDNRDNSLDSRMLSEMGYIPAENLVGRVDILYWTNDVADRRELWIR
jgi:signal peptidase I